MIHRVVLPFGDSEYEVRPSKIICLGQNYREHIAESESIRVGGFGTDVPDEPVLFAKTSNSVVGPGQEIILPEILGRYSFEDERTDYEGELALIVGKGGRNIARSDAMAHIMGFTCANDVSQRNIQTGDRAGWFRGKSFDTFLPLGPRIVPSGAIADIQTLSITTRRNGQVVQDANTAQMIFSVDETIQFVSENFTLEEGDIILTGTPAGVGPISHGDTIEVEIENIGVLSNPVKDPRVL